MVILLTDGQAGLQPGDSEILAWLRSTHPGKVGSRGRAGQGLRGEGQSSWYPLQGAGYHSGLGAQSWWHGRRLRSELGLTAGIAGEQAWMGFVHVSIRAR